LQRTGGHANDFGNLFSGLSPLYKVSDLHHSLWCKLRWSSATAGLRCWLNSRSHTLYLLTAIHVLAIGDVLGDCGLLRHGHCGGFPLKALTGVR
jgi:hypothetical protein